MSPADHIRNLLTEAYRLAKQAHDKCYHDLDTDTPSDKYAVMSHTYLCISKYTEAAAIYWSHPELEDETFLKLLDQFDRVTNEAKKFYKQSNNTTGFYMELQYLETLLEG